ncbi:MAG: cell division protein FtsX [Pikeienuella sp.]
MSHAADNEGFFGRITSFFAPDETPIAPRSPLIGGLIAIVSFAMAFMAVAAIEAGAAADRVAAGWSEELAQSATVRITAPPEKLAEVSASALAVLEIAPGVASARLLSEAELKELMAPWLGRDADVVALPLPALIDVTLEDGGPDAEDIQRQLELAAPGSLYDDHGEWRAPLIEAAVTLRRVAMAGVVLTLIALAAMVAVAAVASLWAGSGVVRTLRLIGAEDQFISRAFERQFAIRAALGGGFGAFLALVIAARMPSVAATGILSTSATATHSLIPWIAPLAPIVCALTALAATRIACLFVLRRT